MRLLYSQNIFKGRCFRLFYAVVVAALTFSSVLMRTEPAVGRSRPRREANTVRRDVSAAVRRLQERNVAALNAERSREVLLRFRVEAAVGR